MRKLCKALIVAQFVLAGMVFLPAPGEAGKIRPTGTINFQLVEVRTPAAMEADEAALQASGKVTEIPAIPFRHTMSINDYKAAKAAANAGVNTNNQGEISPDGPSAPPSYVGPDIEGANQTEGGGWRPPDTHGAVGSDHFVEVTNSHYDVYRKTDGVRVKSIKLESFFGYPTDSLFDSRCVYDNAVGRWIVASEAFPEGYPAPATVQYQFIAVSQTTDPTGTFYVYRADVCFKDNNDFWDFPQIGVDSKSIFITANIFDTNGNYVGADLGVVNKSSLYNGKSTSGKLFTSLDGTLAPPIVLGQSSKSCLVAANSSKKITLYTLTYPGGVPTLSKSSISVPAYFIPPDVSQPGTTAKLDASDARFVNASTQNGNALWQVHTININSRPTPKWYEFNISTKKVKQSGTFTASNTSHDWNASIAANTSNDVFVTWSSTDATAGTNAQVRFSGRRSTDTSGIIDGGSALFTSSTYYHPTSDVPERWGDYSAVTVDPSNPLRAWIVNEKINGTSVWGSRIGCIGY